MTRINVEVKYLYQKTVKEKSYIKKNDNKPQDKQ